MAAPTPPTPQEVLQLEGDALYVAYQELLDLMGFGYCKAQGDAAGTELVMLKRFYTEDDVKDVFFMPIDEFVTVEEFARARGIGEGEAGERLRSLAKRGNIYHELREDGKHYYRAEPAAHGIYEFHAGDFDPEWLGGGLYPHMAGGLLGQVYNGGVPFYRCVPAREDIVAEGELLPEDNLWDMLKTHRRFCVSPCACVNSSRDVLGIHKCDHATGVCLQTDEMADYYLDDLQLGKDVTYEQAEKLLRKNVELGMAMQTTYAKRSEIICSCELCHCGILAAAKGFPGDAMNNISHYYVEDHPERYTPEDAQAAAARCTMGAITVEDGKCITDESCIACGQCCIAMKESKGRILRRKPDDQIRELPPTVWDAYIEMEEFRKAKGEIPVTDF